jgi:hypothetical protein
LSDVLGAEPWPGQRHMNVESMYEYGPRAGFWRLWRMFTERGLPVTVFGVATALARNPDAVAAMREAGFTMRVPDPERFAAEVRVLPFVHSASGIPVDAILAGPGPEEEFLARARVVVISGVRVPVISPEDLVVTKILAGRPKDLEDVRGILRQSVARFDAEQVRSLLALLEAALDRSDLRTAFDDQARAVSKTKG